MGKSRALFYQDRPRENDGFGNLFISGNPIGYKVNFKSFAKNYSAPKNAVIKNLYLDRELRHSYFYSGISGVPTLAMYQILKDYGIAIQISDCSVSIMANEEKKLQISERVTCFKDLFYNSAGLSFRSRLS